VYAYFKELRDFHGKTIIALTGSQIITYLVVPFIRFFAPGRFGFHKFMFIFLALFIVSLAMILLWITVLIVHTYLTFK